MCNFLLVINTNLHSILHLHPVLHHFQDIADYWSNFRFRQGTCIYHIRSGRTPKLRTMKFSSQETRSLYHTLPMFLQTIISFCHKARVCQMDRWTDR